MLLNRDDMPPEARRAHKRIAKACAGTRLDHVASALLLEYCNVLLDGCVDYAQFKRNIDGITAVLDANGRAHFKVNN